MSQDIFDDIHKDCQLSIFLLEKENELLTKKLAVAVSALKQYGGASVYVGERDRNESVAKNALEQIDGMK